MRSAKPAGFTLIELLVTITIAAILVAIAVPAFNSFFAKRRLEGAANKLSADLQFARSQAVADNANVMVKAQGSGGYAVFLHPTPSTSTTPSEYPSYSNTSDLADIVAVSLPTGVSATFGQDIFFWALRGCTSQACTASDATVTVTNEAGSLQATVNRLGRVSLCVPSGSSFGGYPSC